MSGMFGDITVEDFLRDYWQKKPLLIRQAFPGFESPITPDELAGLACETDTSRIVIEKGGKYPWEVRHGAFDDDDFANLPETHWTLLVNDTDGYLPELKAVMEPFRFIPDWRIDDLMISFAVEGGSVGPHVDEYDVFLVQAHGQRRWQINTDEVKADNFIPDLELRIMRDFRVEQEWVLEPGDMLYLPPNIPHYGVALDECMTYSVGFRAPSQADMLESLMEDLLEEPRLQQRFSDVGRSAQSNPGELADADIDRLLDFLIDALPQDTQALQMWLGKYLSEPKVGENSLEPQDISKSEFKKIINRKKSFIKTPKCRFLYFLHGNDTCLFANGQRFTIPATHTALAAIICAQNSFKYSDYQAFLANDECFELLHQMLCSGLIYIKE